MEYESSVVFMVMSAWIMMHKVDDQIHGSPRVRRCMEQIDRMEMVRFNLSSVLYKAENGVLYHHGTDLRLAHRT